MAKHRKLGGLNPLYVYVNDVLDLLRAKELLSYGGTIPQDLLERVIGASPDDGWKYLAPYLVIKEEIEELGFFTSQRNADGLRILTPAEVAPHTERRLNRMIERLDRDKKIVTRTDLTKMSDEEQKRHMFQLRKLARAATELHDLDEEQSRWA